MTRQPKIIWRRTLSYCAYVGQCEIKARRLEDETGMPEASWSIFAYDKGGMDLVARGKADDVSSAKKAALATFKKLPERLREEFPNLSKKERQIERARATVEAFDEGKTVRHRIEWFPEKSVSATVGDFELYASDFESDLPRGRYIYWQLLQGAEEREVAKGNADSLKEAQEAVLAAFRVRPEADRVRA